MTDKALVESYHDADGQPCTLLHLVLTEPTWSVNIIRNLKTDIARSSLDAQAKIDEIGRAAGKEVGEMGRELGLVQARIEALEEANTR